MPSVRISVDSGLLGDVETTARSVFMSQFSDADERKYIEEALTKALDTIRRAYNLDTKEP